MTAPGGCFGPEVVAVISLMSRFGLLRQRMPIGVFAGPVLLERGRRTNPPSAEPRTQCAPGSVQRHSGGCSKFRFFEHRRNRLDVDCSKNGDFLLCVRNVRTV